MTLELFNAIYRGDIHDVGKALPFYIGKPELDEGLLIAVGYGRPAVLEALVKAGADPNVMTPWKERVAYGTATSLAEAVAAREAKLAELRETEADYSAYAERLVRRMPPGKLHAEQSTALILASEAAFMLVEPPPVVDEYEFKEAQQVRWLEKAQAARLAMVETLLAAGADVDGRDSVGRTPLIAATHRDCLGNVVVYEGEQYGYPTRADVCSADHRVPRGRWC